MRCGFLKNVTSEIHIVHKTFIFLTQQLQPNQFALNDIDRQNFDLRLQ